MRERNYEDTFLWRARARAELQSMYAGGLRVDHECVPEINLANSPLDENPRCVHCQKTLKHLYYANERLKAPFTVHYNAYAQIVSQEEQDE